MPTIYGMIFLEKMQSIRLSFEISVFLAKFPNEVPLLVEVEVSLIKILKTSGNPCQGKFHWFY